MIPKHLLIDFEKLKVGDVKHDILYGSITVTEKNKFEFCITGTDIRGNRHIYTQFGYNSSECNYPSLCESNPFDLISEYPKEMMVSDHSIEWEKKLIVYSDSDNEAEGFLDSTGEWWLFAKDIGPEPDTIELTMEVILERLSKHEGKKVVVIKE